MTRDDVIARDSTAERLNAVVNHPDVHPWVAAAGQGALDLAPVVADPRHVCLMAGDGGGFLFMQLEPGVYEVHSQFVPAARGKGSLRAARAALHWMFTRTDCMEVLTKVPEGNLGAAAMARALRFSLDFERAGAWTRSDGKSVPCGFWALRYPDWVRSAPGLIERGRWFHDRLHAEKARLGRETPDHEEDDTHDRHVGAAAEMILAGQPDKGVILYNRWARFAGYAELQLLSRDPAVIDIRDGAVLVRDESFEVI